MILSTEMSCTWLTLFVNDKGECALGLICSFELHSVQLSSAQLTCLCTASGPFRLPNGRKGSCCNCFCMLRNGVAWLQFWMHKLCAKQNEYWKFNNFLMTWGMIENVSSNSGYCTISSFNFWILTITPTRKQIKFLWCNLSSEVVNNDFGVSIFHPNFTFSWKYIC